MGYYTDSDDDSDDGWDCETFYDGKPLKVMRKEFPYTDLLDMFYEINVRNPDSWYKSYRVRTFIDKLSTKGIDSQSELYDYLMKHGDNHQLDLAEEVIDDIKENLGIE